MKSFHQRGNGFSSQLAVKTTAKKMAKSVVGNNMRPRLTREQWPTTIVR
jgi:hypothetical protein